MKYKGKEYILSDTVNCLDCALLEICNSASDKDNEFNNLINEAEDGCCKDNMYTQNNGYIIKTKI